MSFNFGARAKRGGLALGITLSAGATLVSMAVPASAAPRYFHTVGTNVYVRQCASTSCKVVKTLKAKGTEVHAICYDEGSSVNGDDVWYSIDEPTHGFIAGYWVDSGKDPATGITHCYS